MRQGGLDRRVDAVEHDVDRLVECTRRRPGQSHTGHDSGVREDEVQPAEFGHRVGQHRLQPGDIAHVGLGGDDATAGLFHQVDRLVQILGAAHRVGDGVELPTDIHRDDVRALLGESDGMCAALTARGTGDERHFVS